MQTGNDNDFFVKGIVFTVNTIKTNFDYLKRWLIRVGDYNGSGWGAWEEGDEDWDDEVDDWEMDVISPLPSDNSIKAAAFDLLFGEGNLRPARQRCRRCAFYSQRVFLLANRNQSGPEASDGNPLETLRNHVDQCFDPATDANPPIKPAQYRIPMCSRRTNLNGCLPKFHNWSQ